MVGYDDHQRQLTTAQYAFAGAASGFVTRMLLQPLDVVKIRFQLQTAPTIKRYAKPSSKYWGIFQAWKVIGKEEGILALWKGHIPAQLLSVTYGCVQFASFEALTKAAWVVIPHEKYTSLKPVTHFICGGLAGCCSTLVVQPIDVVRTRLVAQGEPKVYNSLSRAVFSMYNENGVRTFYKGLVPTLLEIFPQTGMHFAFYTGFQIIWSKYINKIVNSDISASESLSCGFLSGILSKVFIHPLDVVKKRLQIEGFAIRENSGLHASHSGGMVNCIKTIARVEGLSGFYKGLKVNIIKGASSVGVTFLAYEQCCRYILKIEDMM